MEALKEEGFQLGTESPQENNHRSNEGSFSQSDASVNGQAHAGAEEPEHERIQSSPLSAALYYFDHACFVVPCCTMTAQGACPFPHRHDTEKSIGKVPLLGTGWQHARLTREEIIEWWTKYPTANVGVLLEPSGLMVVDLDSEEATEEASRKGLPPGPQVRAGRGVHHYFLNPKNIVGLAIKKGTSHNIDVLSKGIVVGAGSLHRRGKRYEFLTTWEEWPLEEPPSWAEVLLLESLKAKASAEELPGDLPPVDLDALQIPLWLQDVIRDGQPKHYEEYPSRSEAVWAVVTALVKAGHDNATIASILLDSRFAISSKPREQGPRWVAGEIGRARVKTQANGTGAGFADDGRGSASPGATTGDGASVGNESPEESEEEEDIKSDFLAFPEGAWRGVFETYREAMDGTTEASDVYHFATFWTAVAVRLRRKTWFPYGLDLYPNVYLCVYGPTGDRKTTATRRSVSLVESEHVKILQGGGSGEGVADWLKTEGGALISHYMFLEEISELLARGKWDGATLIPFITRLFDSPNSYAMNYRKNPIALVNPTLSILAATTPEVFWQYIRDLDLRSGFVNRFGFLTGKGKAPIPLPKKPDTEKLKSILQRLDLLTSLVPQEASFSPEATQLWKSFYSVWGATELESLTKAATERTPAYIIKLALAYAALENTLPKITEEQLKAAIAVGRYATKCTEQLIAVNRQSSVQSRCEDAIRRVLKDTPRWLSRRQLWLRISGRFDSWQFSKALDGLVLAGEVQSADGSRHGQTLYQRHGRKPA